MSKSPKKIVRKLCGLVSVLRTTCQSAKKKAGKKSTGKKRNVKITDKKFNVSTERTEPVYIDNYYRWGFLNVQFKSQAKFNKLLKKYKLTEFKKNSNPDEGRYEFSWSTKDHSLVIYCSINPITGEYYNYDETEMNFKLVADSTKYKKNYAESMTIESYNRKTLLEFVVEMWDSTSSFKEDLSFSL